MQVEVHHVHAHVARAGLTHDGIEVGAVVVAEGAGFVDQPGDLEDVLLEESQRVRIRQHDGRGAVGEVAAQRAQVYETPRGAGDLDDLVSSQGGRREICAVSRIGDDDLVSAPRPE